jgi:hypothetical protein
MHPTSAATVLSQLTNDTPSRSSACTPPRPRTRAQTRRQLCGEIDVARWLGVSNPGLRLLGFVQCGARTDDSVWRAIIVATAATAKTTAAAAEASAWRPAEASTAAVPATSSTAEAAAASAEAAAAATPTASSSWGSHERGRDECHVGKRAVQDRL